MKQFIICVKPPCNLRQIIVCFDADYRLFCVKLQRKLHGVTRQVYGNLRKYQMRAAINNMDICRRPQIFRDIEKSRQETFPLKFRSPCRKRHPRISQKILEDIKVISIQTNSFRFLRRCSKLVLPSLGTVGRCSLSERNEESNGAGEVSIRSAFPCVLGLLVASDI